MKTINLKPNVFCNGVLDPDLKTFDIIMETKYGTTYNSYVVKGSEKTALIETAKEKFFDGYFESIKEIVDVDKIDYIIVNHTEPDHAGSVEKLLELNSDITVVGTVSAINFLNEIVNKSFKSMVVKDGETLSLGDKTLHFISAPNLHWPDTMYTYLEEDKVLFTCDSFGSHFCHSGILRSTVTNTDGYLEATKYYFDNILGPFKPFVIKALDKVDNIQVEMICPGHGPVLDSHIDELKQLYRQWSKSVNPNNKPTVVIPYVSAYGYTKALAQEIASGIMESKNVDVTLFDMEIADSATVLDAIFNADGVLFGSPTILGEALPPILNLTSSLCSVLHKGKLASAFGSYGWSGEAVPHIVERLKQLKMKTVDGFTVRFKPSDDELKKAKQYGIDFANQLAK